MRFFLFLSHKLLVCRVVYYVPRPELSSYTRVYSALPAPESPVYVPRTRIVFLDLSRFANASMYINVGNDDRRSLRTHNTRTNSNFFASSFTYTVLFTQVLAIRQFLFLLFLCVLYVLLTLFTV